MRVLTVTPLYPPDSRVGSWLSTHELMRHMLTRGHHVDVVTTLGTEAYEVDGIEVHPRRSGEVGALAAAADVVVSHLGDGDMGARAAQTAGKPSVRLVHGWSSSRPNVVGLRRWPTALAVFGSDAAKTASGWGGPSMVVNPPVRPTDYQCTPGDRVTLVNLSSAKGVKVAWQVSDALPHLSFLGCRGGYGRQVEPRSGDWEIVGPVRDMRDVYSRTRVLLVPSSHETYGRVAVEAMCSGIPVVASPLPGLIEATDGAATYVDRSDIDGWVDAVDRLTSDPDAWQTASDAALARSQRLDADGDMDRFAEALEGL